MKKPFYILSTLSMIMFFVMCESGPKLNSNITLVKTDLGGCNIDSSQLRSSSIVVDTVIYSTKNDTLKVFVGYNFKCCALFTNETKINNDSIIITLKDTASSHCRCYCYYTWDFSFTKYKNKKYYIKVLIDGTTAGSPLVFKEDSLYYND